MHAAVDESKSWARARPLKIRHTRARAHTHTHTHTHTMCVRAFLDMHVYLRIYMKPRASYFTQWDEVGEDET
jgi:hypothetical protein